MSETNIMRRIQKALTVIGARVFRNQVGSYLLAKGGYLSSGLCKGSSDLIGWMPVKITQQMVGQTVAVFTGIEVKGPKGKLTFEQITFIEQVRAAGGIAVVAKSEGEAIEGVRHGAGKP